VDPFFVAGPQDIGLGWRVLTSLQRVAIGYGLAGVIGIALGTIIGQSVWAMRGLDPIFQVLRTISPLAWLPISLAAFRDSQPSAILVIFITSVWPIIQRGTRLVAKDLPDDQQQRQHDQRRVRPATMLSSVDLPHPEWPMMETYSPFSMPTVMSASTSVSCAPRRKVLST
jgi:ABC-type nitrate/sulfonate/bicarbonate transport system permease component